MFLGENLLAYLVLAFGAALAVGNVLAYIRPPAASLDPSVDRDLDPQRPPLGRTMIMAAIGLLAAAWAIASLIKG